MAVAVAVAVAAVCHKMNSLDKARLEVLPVVLLAAYSTATSTRCLHHLQANMVVVDLEARSCNPVAVCPLFGSL